MEKNDWRTQMTADRCADNRRSAAICVRNEHGHIYVEYFILALIVALATIAFWKGPGGFARARATVENAFDNSVNRVLAP